MKSSSNFYYRQKNTKNFVWKNKNSIDAIAIGFAYRLLANQLKKEKEWKQVDSIEIWKQLS